MSFNISETDYGTASLNEKCLKTIHFLSVHLIYQIKKSSFVSQEVGNIYCSHLSEKRLVFTGSFSYSNSYILSHVTKIPGFCNCKSQGTDQLLDRDIANHQPSKSEFYSLQRCLCLTKDILKTGFLAHCFSPVSHLPLGKTMCNHPMDR